MGIEIFLIAVVWFFFQLEDVASWVCTNLSYPAALCTLGSGSKILLPQNGSVLLPF